jgi:ubiquinone/menaquinone biosynthesis C-methylase UbiE
MIPPPTQHVYEQNRRVWDARVRQRLAHTGVASESDFHNPLRAVDARGWLGASVAGQRVLCLAGGGGFESVLLATAGAEVTVVDLSPAMLEQDRRVAAERGVPLRLIEGSMDDLSMLGDASFDVVMQPVSTCYVPDIARVYREVARVTAPGGLYLSQHKQPSSLQTSEAPGLHGYFVTTPYYHAGPLPPVLGQYAHRENGAVEFLHRWETLIGELCHSGFVIEDLAEPRHADPTAPPGSLGHRSQFVPPYVAIKARRTRAQGESTHTSLVRL